MIIHALVKDCNLLRFLMSFVSTFQHYSQKRWTVRRCMFQEIHEHLLRFDITDGFLHVLLKANHRTVLMADENWWKVHHTITIECLIPMNWIIALFNFRHISEKKQQVNKSKAARWTFSVNFPLTCQLSTKAAASCRTRGWSVCGPRPLEAFVFPNSQMTCLGKFWAIYGYVQSFQNARPTKMSNML